MMRWAVDNDVKRPGVGFSISFTEKLAVSVVYVFDLGKGRFRHT